MGIAGPAPWARTGFWSLTTRISPARGVTARPMPRTIAAEAAAVVLADCSSSNGPHKRAINVIEVEAEFTVKAKGSVVVGIDI